MKRGSTLVLRAVVWLMGLVVLGICLIALPPAIHTELQGDFDYAPLLLGLYFPAIPFFVALKQTLKLIGYIDHNQAFTPQSVIALKLIKYCAYIISGLFAAGMPYIFYLADRDDAPGLAAIGFIIIGASFVIGTAAAVFQQLVQHAADLKMENDLTV